MSTIKFEMALSFFFFLYFTLKKKSAVREQEEESWKTPGADSED